MMNILLLLPPKEADLQMLRTQFPQCQFYTREDLATLDLAEVDITLGWDSILGLDKDATIGTTLIHNGRLRWVQSMSAGVDYFPQKEMQAHNIILTSASGVNATSIAETVMYYILAEAHKLYDYDKVRRSDEWGKVNKTAPIRGRKALIFGTGAVGQKIAESCAFLGISVVGVNRSGKIPNETSFFTEVIAEQTLTKNPDAYAYDYVINAMPLTKATVGYFNKTRLSTFADGYMFINVGRGKSVVEDDLVALLTSGKVGFAALDVFETEPLPLTSALLTLDNVILTPHTSGNVPEFSHQVYLIFAENLTRFLNNEPLKNVVAYDKEY